jgi:hypothetical protein
MVGAEACVLRFALDSSVEELAALACGTLASELPLAATAGKVGVVAKGVPSGEPVK